ncbi:RPP25L, partial [Symbiodinium sp. KB8]
MAQQGMPSTKHQRVSVEQFDQADEFENYYVISSSQEPALAAAEVTIAASAGHSWKVVPVAEFVKRRVAGLHQVSTITHEKCVKKFAPTEEGCEVVTVETYSPVLRITLTTDASKVSTDDPGYQPPLPAGEVVPEPAPLY